MIDHTLAEKALPNKLILEDDNMISAVHLPFH